MAINTSSRSQQAKADVLAHIEKNKLKRNDPLPSEAAMAKMLTVSRNTVREAYILLEKENVIVRRHGLGTFVAGSQVIRDSLNEFLPFAQMIEQGGYTPGFETLSMKFESAPAHVARVLGIPETEKIRRIKRLVRADKQPVIYVDDFIAPSVESAALNWDAFDGNMVKFLSSSRQIALHQIQSNIRVKTLSAEIAKYLKLKKDAPILNVWSTIFSVENQPMTFSEVCFNSDVIELSIARTIRA